MYIHIYKKVNNCATGYNPVSAHREPTDSIGRESQTYSKDKGLNVDKLPLIPSIVFLAAEDLYKSGARFTKVRTNDFCSMNSLSLC